MKINFKEKTAYHCETKEEAKELLKIAHEQGYKWCDGKSYLDVNHFDDYGSETCYNIFCGEYCHLQFYVEQNYKIVKAKDIFWTPELLEEIEVKYEHTQNWYRMFYFGKFKEQFLYVNSYNFDRIVDGYDSFEVCIIDEIRPLPKKTVLTKQEIAEKFNIDINELEIEP